MITLSLCSCQGNVAAAFFPSRPPAILSFAESHLSRFLVSQEQISHKLRSSSAVKSTGEDDRRASTFFDEDGVVQDMDGYLNFLSLEYDSVWDTKPSWCQPWTITLTGVLLIACSWLLLHSPIVTSVVSTLICLWWYIFLYSYPQAYAKMIAERRKKVTSGLEDTYGSRKL